MSEYFPIAPGKPWLAPLAGYSDLPFRLLCREYGACVCETEMVSARGLMFDGAGSNALLSTCAADTPLVVQLFGNEAHCIGESMQRLCRQGYEAFDLNMGCPVPKVMRQGAGAAMPLDMRNALEVAARMIEVAKRYELLNGTQIRVGFKMRLGIDESCLTFEDLACRLEDLGATWITLHPRTARQGYKGRARWDMLELLSSRLDIPVIASGDLLDARAGLACMSSTGASGLMYARGALHNPGIFKEHIERYNGVSPSSGSSEDIKRMVCRHIRLSVEHAGEKNVFFKMRSVIPRYVKNFPGVKRLRQELCACSNWDELELLIGNFFDSI